MGRHHHKRGRQSLDTLYYQGRADGRRGRPRHHDKMKWLRGVWYWHENHYWRGYNDGKREKTPFLITLWKYQWARTFVFLSLGLTGTLAILSPLLR